MNNEMEDAIDCNEWIIDSRQKQVVIVSFFMALAYALYAVLELSLASKHIAQSASLQYISFVASSFLILSLLAYKQNTQLLALYGLMLVPILVAVVSMVMLQNADSIPFYLLEMSIIIVWVFILCGLRFRQALITASMVLFITFYSMLIYHSQILPSPFIYLFLLVVLFVFSLLGAFFIEKLTVELCEKTFENQELSMTDELTELPSRAKFDFIIHSELERSRRYKYRFGILMIEIDDFKNICNKFGKEVRDDLLVVVSSMITEEVRSTDMEIRWSEHEFVVVCLELDIVQLRKIANSILQSMRDYDFGRLGRVTLSIGATINKVSDNDTSIVNRAKQALFKARRNNGNSVESL
jgi:diguanylate cyclase (GGDEF)-like protein